MTRRSAATTGGSAATASEPSADLVLIGGSVLTMDEAGSRAEAVAVAGGRILAVGAQADIEPLIGANTRVIDLDGRALLPGINDSHLHAAWLGARWPHTFFGAPDPEVAAQLSGALAVDREARRAAILNAGRMLSELGITSYTEPGIGPGEDDGETGCFHSEVLDVYRELAAEGELQQRVTMLALYGVLDGPSDVETVLSGIRERAAAAPEPEPTWLNVPGVKIFGDLIPLSRQAWTDRAYDDGTHGDLLVDGDSIEQKAEGLAEMIRAAHAAGLQIGLHATGDRTIGLALDAIAEAAAQPGAPTSQQLGHVIIHGDLATSDQVRRMAKLGVWFNAQPGIATITGSWLASMMGADAAAEAWQFGAALDAGVLVLSSDAPVLHFDWRHWVAAAEERIVMMGGDASPEVASARLHRLLRAYTAVPAAQDRAASWKGTVEVGKVADLVVLARDPFEVGAEGLPEVPVDLTVLDGQVIFER
ncbi:MULTISPECIES: amidohydrolase [unclassified Leucobacter]|uniref:amidohydrolase n=1 Tax=unclassified Leucobacter TaxID=2621730 RepID=UPI00301763F9